jgi:hypothetical protein
MIKRFCLTTLIVALLFSATAYAEPEDFVNYDLSLAGYQLGMTFDEAAEVRPFQYLQEGQGDPMSSLVADAFVDQVYIDDIETNLWLRFKDGKIHKIIVRFSPELIADMAGRFMDTLGRAEDRSRTLTNLHGVESRQTVYRWAFPNSRIHLVGVSSNSNYATIGLVSKSVEVDDPVRGDEDF